MPYIIPETMPADWIVDFAVDDTTGDIADAMRNAYDNTLRRQGLDNLMGRLKAACLAAAENARYKARANSPFVDFTGDGAILPSAVQDWPDNAAE